MIKGIKWLFFDLGSTLVDESVAFEYRMQIVAEKSGLSLDEIMKKVIGYYEHNQKGDHKILEELHVEKPKWRFDMEILFDDTKEVLETLHQKYKIGLIANQQLGTKDRLVKYGIDKYIDLVVASTEEGVSKPNPKIFEIALERAECKPCDAIMIGDRTDNDIVPAKKMGMTTVWMKKGPWGHWTIRSDEEKADYTVTSLTEFMNILIK